MRYIGIRGHRGAGKSSVGFLLGQTLEFITNGGIDILDSDAFDNHYYMWCEKLMINPNYINEYDGNTNIYYESFSDNIKLFIRMLLGCPDEYLSVDAYKDTILVNLRDLSCKDKSEVGEVKLWSASELHDSIDHQANPSSIASNTYMTLREFIMYFGLEVMQRYFGKNVWVKSLKATSEEWDRYLDGVGGVSYKIFIDVKTPAEATYIKQNNGIIVNVERPSNKKGKSGLERLGNDDRIDYNIVIDGNLYSTKNKVISIAKDIVTKFNNQNG